jgi:S-adenosylmethionine hydrolase
MSGALALADSLPFFPPGTIHVAVVDPGVGSKRRPIVVKTAKSYFVGPDNGLFWLAIERWGGLEKSWRITNQEFLLHPVSATFHGRDIFAPVAAHLSRGVRPDDFGPEIDDLENLLLPRPLLKEKKILGEVIGVDTFGNLITNITSEILRSYDNQKLTVTINGISIGGLSAAYSDVPAGNALAIVGSSDRLEIACFRGSAAGHFDAGRGTPVEVNF